MTILLQGRFNQADKATGDYRLLPFTVPAGTRRIEVAYHYDREGGNVLDIGLFDPRGSDFLVAEGFRGWSGSARDRFVLSEHGATPGYLPGPLLPGAWQLLLGLYRIAPGGCHYRIEIELFEEGGTSWPAPSDVPPRSPPLAPRWYRGDLQSHSHHSDATGSVADLAGAARRQGLDFVAVTDHNTISHHPDLRVQSSPDLLLIPGEEITTYYGHANVWGLDRWLDFRCRTREEVARVIEEAHRRELLFSINHPKQGGPPWEYGGDLLFDCVEVWHGFWANRNEEALQFWESLLRAGRRVVAVGGSDCHQVPLTQEEGPLRLGRPTTHVYAERLTCEGILKGIQDGHLFITADVDSPSIYLNASIGDEVAIVGDTLAATDLAAVRCQVTGANGYFVRLVGGQGEIDCQPIREPDALFQWTVDLAEQRYIRAEVRAAPLFPEEPVHEQAMIAMTNPIYATRQP